MDKKTVSESPNQIDDNEKIEICYMCHQEFNINEDDDSHYHYDNYPMCAYCSEFYGFYKKDR
ncbi:hypothetical protein MBBAR_1c01640 [Methanobrevibacter arboriphilus JCM 13429 = DSM 1125]|uniref:Uncharacterized protein n=1 Tax=Methanobrevibacter arboriphilus JCM 13429 = DSM 1125 TaxID=1300164 RepID=A0A1V6N5A7_METAZ|nr:hypothetical protein [Methanobrevibacter arboriphilus]OQD59767.1 hypothetical protein MBBAR_1c01640 [Methanobrevibacter arboriphilus JCM 13429 = DSM 1125]